MKISRELFQDFWNAKGKYLRVENTERFKTNLSNKIEELGTTTKLDDYVCSLKTRRESTRKIVVAFYTYLNSLGNRVKSDLPNKRFYDYPFERQLEIAKFLHKPKTNRQIQEKFDIDERTVRKDLQELEEGITVLGSTIQIKKEKKGREYRYKSTLHPIFLPLNLTEVYAMTVYLKNTLKGYNINREIIENISDRIVAQLSDYAFERIFPGVDRNDRVNDYIDDEELARQRKGVISYLMKSGEKCKFLWHDQEYIGGIIHDENSGYQIQLDSGEILDADIAEVDFIVEELEYV